MKITDEMVNRFLCWTLPKDFAPDGGVAFTPPSNPNHAWPVGTNVFTAAQARAMLEHAIGAVPESGAPIGYAVRMADGPFVGIWQDRADAERVCAKQPAGHGDKVVPVYAAPVSATRTIPSVAIRAIKSLPGGRFVIEYGDGNKAEFHTFRDMADYIAEGDQARWAAIDRADAVSTTPLISWLRDNAPDCGDNSCLFGGRGKGGMRTNGGCRCMSDLPTKQRIYVERMQAALSTASATQERK